MGRWRPFAIVTALVAAAGGTVILWGGGGPALLIVGTIALVAVLIEPVYRSPAGGAGAGMQPTPERFTDPETGLATRVWFDPATGERHYVAEEGRAP